MSKQTQSWYAQPDDAKCELMRWRCPVSDAVNVLGFAAHAFGDTREQAVERARLIQAAPDLLAACEAYLYGRAEAGECEGLMRDAVAKAKGGA